MKGHWKNYLEHTLLAGNILLLFLLLFEKNIVLPFWFQPIGRLHPMLLHFPIALLFLSLILEIFSSKSTVFNQEPFQKAASNLFLISCISAAFTALVGLFLSFEEGYEANSIFWHKYSGAAVVFLCSAIYWVKDKIWFSKKIAQITNFGALALITFASHHGASITHGEQFITASFFEKEHQPAPFEQAIIFEDLIEPIFDKKCISCHNSRKAKGELILASVSSMLKGGKSGPLFVAGHPETSTIIDRFFLPLEDKEHMPPSGKTQLTRDEINLFRLWIQKNAPINLKVATLPSNDSISIIGRKLLTPVPQAIKYDFKKADPEKVAKLNNEYRVITSLSKQSPALEVAFFNAKAFQSENLSELFDIKEQVISLNLNKIPVTDSDLETISTFENLYKLNLNFSQITSDGLARLTNLNNLKSLSLAGIKLKKEDLYSLLSRIKSLTSISVWNTEIDQATLNELRKKFPAIDFINGREGLESLFIGLNSPSIANISNIFKDSLVLKLDHAIKDVDIRFSLDQFEVDSLKSSQYKPGQIILKESKQIKTRAFKKGWLGSEVSVLNVYKSKYEPDTVYLLSKLNRVHPANGAQTFFDKQLGTFNANSPAWANNWAGFQVNDMELLLHYKKAVPVSKVSFNVLIEPETAIFAPGIIEIWGGTSEDDLKLLVRLKPKQPINDGKPYIELIDCAFKSFTGTHFKIIAQPLKPIPTWHSRKGKTALFLVDELFVN